MLNADFYDKLLYLVMVCSSIYNVIFTVSMNKKSSRFKALAIAFFAPALLCCAAFLYPTNIAVAEVGSLSEVCLIIGILLLTVYPYESRNHNIVVLGMIAAASILTGYAMTTDDFIYFSLSDIVRLVINITLLIATLIYMKIKQGDRRIMAPLSLMLAGVMLELLKSNVQIDSIITLIKGSGYIAFSYYFYKLTYSSYMNRINETESIIRNMEHSLNKEVKKRVFEIERSNERLLEISKTDMLTKAFNKITILNIIERLINNKKIDTFSIVMFDIDNFKVINDSLGHVTGDLCLKTLANIASGNIREVDYLGRYGGDEFIIVLPTLGFNEARFVAERFKQKVNETSNPRFTVSIGISTYPNDGQTVNELISVADKGLYKSKNKGKNSISHANSM